MELRYNLTRDDYLRGLSLHEGRLKGPLSVLRLAARLLFLLPTGVGALGLLMLGVVCVWGEWEEGFTRVLGLLLVLLIVGALEVALLSPQWRAGRRLRVNRPDAAFFGPRAVTLTAEGVAARYGENRLVLPGGSSRRYGRKRASASSIRKAGRGRFYLPVPLNTRRNGRRSRRRCMALCPETCRGRRRNRMSRLRTGSPRRRSP